jgi:nitroreductase
MPRLNLTVDEVLSTTRAVRRRLDLARPVERGVIEECMTLAQQAPNGGNLQRVRFVVVTEPDRRAALADIWRRRSHRVFESYPDSDRKGANERTRMQASFRHLDEHLHEVPVLVIPCIQLDRPREKMGHMSWTIAFADAHMATWSFMLAARERGLGTCLTTLHLPYEEEAAHVLGMPYNTVVQTALLPVAYTVGTGFRPGPRGPVGEVLRWERW